MMRRTATAIIVEEFISEWSGFEVKKEEAATDSRNRRAEGGGGSGGSHIS